MYNNNMERKKIIDDFSKIATLLYEKNYSEGFGGNLSICISKDAKHILKDYCLKDISPTEIDLDIDVDPLNNDVIIITTTGSRMYQVKDNAENYISVLFIDNGTIFNMNGKIPSSELKAHIASYIANTEIGALVHTHPPYLIAASDIFDSKKNFNKALIDSHAEFNLVFRDGIGMLETIAPGSDKLAAKTAEKFKTYPLVIWKNHGAIAGANDLFTAFDYIDIVEKCSKIALMKIV